MAEIERLNVDLPSAIAESIRQAVDTGEYASASDVVSDALQLWSSRRDMHEHDLNLLRKRWDEGKASGNAGPFNIEKIIAEGKRRLHKDMKIA